MGTCAEKTLFQAIFTNNFNKILKTINLIFQSESMLHNLRTQVALELVDLPLGSEDFLQRYSCSSTCYRSKHFKIISWELRCYYRQRNKRKILNDFPHRSIIKQNIQIFLTDPTELTSNSGDCFDVFKSLHQKLAKRISPFWSGW